MSDSVKKYQELQEEGALSAQTPNQQSVTFITEILEQAKKAGTFDKLMQKVAELSLKTPTLSPTAAFMIANQEVMVGNVCGNKEQE